MTKTEHVFKGTWKGTRAEYEAIASPDPDILYCITDEPPASTAYVDAGLALKQDISGMSAYATQTDLQQGLATREPVLSDAQHAAVNSGITAGKVNGYDSVGLHRSSFVSFVNGEVTARANYVRIAPKVGILSLAMFVSPNSNATYDYIPLSGLGSALGVNFKTPSSTYSTGEWYGTLDAETYFGYGSNLSVKSNGYIELQRAYNSGGSIGGWALNVLGDNRYIITNVVLEEQ